MQDENPNPAFQPQGDNTIAKLEAVMISGSKVKVILDLHEGNDRPNLSIALVDLNGELLARSFIISCVDQHVDFTLHIRHPDPVFPLTLHCESFFEADQPIDQKTFSIENPVS